MTRLSEVKKRVKSELKYLNEKLDRWKDMFRSVLQKKKNKQIKTKQKRESKYLEVTGDVIVESLTRLLVRQARWLTKLAKNGGLTERAITTT